jgi:hypothetical protein
MCSRASLAYQLRVQPVELRLKVFDFLQELTSLSALLLRVRHKSEACEEEEAEAEASKSTTRLRES